jgi:hypothetical protein
MRLIGAASIVFALALTFAITESPPALTASQTAALSDQGNNNHRIGQAIFRYDTFGDEQLWTDVLRMHEVVATVPPATALAVGLKVDVEALPQAVTAALRAGEVDLTNPAVTVELLRLNSVVGVQGKVNDLASSRASASPARFVIPRWTTRSPQGLANDWTAGPTSI